MTDYSHLFDLFVDPCFLRTHKRCRVVYWPKDALVTQAVQLGYCPLTKLLGGRGNQLSYPHCLPTDSSAQYSYMLCNFDNFRRSFGLVEQHWSFMLHPLMQGYIEDKKPNTCNITLKRSVFFNWLKITNSI